MSEIAGFSFEKIDESLLDTKLEEFKFVQSVV